MPDAELLEGVQVGPLNLADFFSELNKRVSENVGREKQIGHSYFLSSSDPVSDPEDFAALIREDVIPLLQECCLDDYSALASLLGTTIVNVEERSMDGDILHNAEELISNLSEAYQVSGSEAS